MRNWKENKKFKGEESNQEPTASHENEAVDLVEVTSDNQNEGKSTDVEKEVPDFSIMNEAAEIPMNEGGVQKHVECAYDEFEIHVRFI